MEFSNGATLMHSKNKGYAPKCGKRVKKCAWETHGKKGRCRLGNCHLSSKSVLKEQKAKTKGGSEKKPQKEEAKRSYFFKNLS
jgi:hypothetical protein